MTLADRLWSKVRRGSDAECWPFVGYCRPNGYGSIHHEGRPELAHRAAWIVTHGSIPDGMLVCHHCDNPPCVRPDHLFLGTDTDNNRDRERKGRSRLLHGSASPNARLNESAVRRIRAIAGGVSDEALAAEYGVTDTAIFNARRGISWKHVK